MNSLVAELRSIGRTEKIFILFSMLICFCIGSEYAITRPASLSLFLTAFSAKGFPYVWLATVPLNLLVISLYNRFLPRVGPLRVLMTIISFVIGVNLLCFFLLSSFPQLIFFHFAWKDIYILLMFKQLWSMIHTTISAHRAKILYGIIFSMGTLGGIAGSFLPGFFSVAWGSETLFLFTLPIYLVLGVCYRKAIGLSRVPTESFGKDLTNNPRASEAFSLIRRNGFLAAVLCLVILMQVSVALIEYQFSATLELNILEKDLRTEYCGRLMGLTNLLSGAFQLVGTYLLVHVLGLRKSHFLIPLLLLGSALLSFSIPTFGLISFSFVFLKAIDFSLFAIIREMLYIPLQLDEKYRAKAVIDVFAYRTSKAFVSLTILALQSVAGFSLLSIASYASLVVFVAWMGVVAFMFRKHKMIYIN